MPLEYDLFSVNRCNPGWKIQHLDNTRNTLIAELVDDFQLIHGAPVSRFAEVISSYDYQMGEFEPFWLGAPLDLNKIVPQSRSSSTPRIGSPRSINEITPANRRGLSVTCAEHAGEQIEVAVII